jgi:hypothetical protein
VTKEDANFVVSSCHPDLKDPPPRTEKAIAAKKAAGKATGRKLVKIGRLLRPVLYSMTRMDDDTLLCHSKGPISIN